MPKKFVVEPFSVSENFGYRKILWIGGGGREYHDFLSKICCLTVPKNFVGESFGVSGNFLVSKHFTDKRGVEREGVSRFSDENFLSHSAEKFRRGTLLCCVSENFR